MGQNWRQKEPPSPGRFYMAWNICFVGALIGTLFILFLDQSSSEDDFYIELVRLVGVLALVASGLIYVRRVKFGEVVRNISIWTGLAAVVLLGYTYRTELSQIVYRVS